MGLSAAIDSLLHTVDTFLKDRGSQAATLESAQAQVQQLQPFEARVGKWYLKVMNNVKKKGVGYLQAEYAPHAACLDSMCTPANNSQPAAQRSHGQSWSCAVMGCRRA